VKFHFCTFCLIIKNDKTSNVLYIYFQLLDKLISVINDYGVDFEHTFVYFCTEILILTCSTSYNIL